MQHHHQQNNALEDGNGNGGDGAVNIALEDDDMGLVNIEATEMIRLLMNTLPDLRISASNATNESIQQPPLHYTIVTFSEPEEIAMDDYEFNVMLSELMGNVNTGVRDMSAVLKDTQWAGDGDEVCVICQEKFAEIATDGQIVETCCGHMFCRKCIETWFAKHKKCPICQCDVEDFCAKKIETGSTQNESI